jgi:hypothetical protein
MDELEQQVTGQSGSQGAPGVANGGQGHGGAESITISKAELDAIRREATEARQASQYWAEYARRGGQPQAQPQEEQQPEDEAGEFVDAVEDPTIEGDTPAKLIDEFAAKGTAALKARGFITAADAYKLAVDVASKVSQGMIGKAQARMSTDQKIMTEFPELRDQGSDLFKETAKRYQAAVAMDPRAKSTPAALYLAAQAAKEALGRTQRPNPADDYDPEQERRDRIAAQDGRQRVPTQRQDDDMMGDQAREVARMMGISDDEFKRARKELGVRRGGRRGA